MIIYKHETDLTEEQLNVLGLEDWELIEVVRNFPDQATKHFYLKKDDQIKSSDQYTLIQNTETEAEFYLDKTFSYGEAVMITFITIFFFAFLGKIIFNYFFYNE